MVQLKVRKIGNSLGVILPKEALSTLHCKEGDVLQLDQVQGKAVLTAENPDFAEKMKKAESIMERYADTLHELAK